MHTMDNKGHGRTNSILGLDSSRDSAWPTSGELDEGDFDLPVYGSGITWPDGGGEASSTLDRLLAQDNLAGPLGDHPEFAEATLRDLPFPICKKEAPSREVIAKLTVDDFEEGPERWALLAIKTAVQLLLNSRAKDQDIMNAGRWLLGFDDGPLSFENCCRVHGARPGVVQLRLQFELWKRWHVFSEPIQLGLFSLPEEVADSIRMRGGRAAVNVAERIWQQPGIMTLDAVRDQDECAALERLDEASIASQQGDNWYLTGRNPSAKGRRDSSWSDLFPW